MRENKKSEYLYLLKKLTIKFLKNKSLSPDGSISIFYQTFKKKKNQSYTNSFKNGIENTSSNFVKSTFSQYQY